jgi:hypothetical protein
MKLRLKLTAAVTALALCSVTSATIAMDEFSNAKLSYQTFQTGRVTNPFLNVDIVKDQQSGSFTMHAHSEIKSKVLDTLSKETGHKDVRKILQLDGGGVRGLFSIFELCVLEEIINHPDNAEIKARLLEEKRQRCERTNKKDDLTRLYIRDLFDVGTGTSTGSILTAGLFSTINLSAIDVAKLYARYGYKIFDEQKRYVMPGLGIGLSTATYDNAGLQELLIHYFGNSHLQDVHKPIYIAALNEGNQSVALFSTDPLDGDHSGLYKTYLREAVLYSSSAPTFLPGVKGVHSNGSTLYSDGGTVANNTTPLVFDKETRNHGNPYEVFSFGTGITQSPPVRSGDTGAAAVGTVLINTLVAQEKLACSRCVDEIFKFSSQLQYFARINPELEPDMVKLDDTSETYVQYAIKKAFSVTQGPAFADMVARLGFNMPELGLIHEQIRKNIMALKSNIYYELDPYEKEFVMKRVLDLDFKLYDQRLYQDQKTGEFKRISDDDARTFLEAVTNDMAKKKREGDGVLSRMLSWISTSNEDNIMEFIPRCLEFHKLSFGNNTLTEEVIGLLKAQQGGLFLHPQLQKLSPDYTINGDGRWHNSDATPQPGLAADLVFDMFMKFIGMCKQDGATYKYTASNDKFAHLPALIFWKNAFHQIEDKLTRDDLLSVYKNLKQYEAQILRSRSYTYESTARIVRSSRYEILVEGLLTYINKYHKE